MSLLDLIKLIVATALLAGCQSPGKLIRNVPPEYSSESRVPQGIIKTASETYLYAQMSNNAYARAPSGLITLPDEITEVPFEASVELNLENERTGLAFKVFEWDKGAGTSEIVIAFRGSEKGYKDWVIGNIEGRQAPLSVLVYDEVLKQYPNHPISVTGDSLGGSLATQVSLCRDIHLSVSLNTSPRFSRSHCRDFVTSDNDPNLGKRHSITERGEALKLIRIPGREASQLYTSVNCIPGWSPFHQHDVLDLAHV